MKKQNAYKKVCGTFCFYANFIDGTMLPALGTLTNQQNKQTNVTIQQFDHFLNYCASHLSVEI